MTRQEQIKQAATAKSRGETPYYYDAFIEGAKWADEHPHWISVEEKRPPCKEDVLLWSSGFDVALKGFRNDEDLYYVYDDDTYWHNITHWMALPQLPIVSKMENTEKKGGQQ